MEEPDWLQALAEDETYGWARLAWRRAAAVEGAWFDHRLADGVVAEWPSWATLTEDRFAGLPFHLLPWQAIIVRLLVGWMVPVEVLDPLTHRPRVEHVRLFRRLLLWVPRKNGKSEFLAALALLFFVLDRTISPQGYLFARTQDQAKLVFRKMKDMIANSAELAEAVVPYKRSLWFKELRGAFELLTGSEEGKHGKSPTVIVGDEMHEWRSLEIPNTLRQGTGARLAPIEIYASTAGLKTNATGVQLWDESVSILEGRTDDPSSLVVIFAAEPEADWQDEGVWRKANPSLGLSPTLDFLRREARMAVDNPRQLAHFLRYHLNIWVDSLVRWLNIKRWDACAPDKTAWRTAFADLKGRRCFGAFDVSSTQDLTALFWLFPPVEADPRWRVACRFWVPADTLAERVKTDRVPYDRFLKDGALETTPGDYVDQNYVLKAVLDGFELFEVERVGFDPWNAQKLVADLEKDGVEAEVLTAMRQGIMTLGEPSKHFERLVYAGLLDHGGHPVLRWMAANAVVRFDENMNFAPAKKRSSEKIDGIVAGVMAAGLALCGKEEEGFDMDDFLADPVMVA